MERGLCGRLRIAGYRGPQALFPSPGRPKPLYIAGYGAMFFIQVDFPLLAPPEKAQEQPAEAQEDTVWAQTKQSLLEPRTAGQRPRKEPRTALQPGQGG